MKKSILAITLLCAGCAYNYGAGYQGNYQQRIEAYRSQCMYTYGYRTSDAIAQCVQTMELQNSQEEAIRSEQREWEMNREMDRSQRKVERNLRQKEREEKNFEIRNQKAWNDYYKWEKEQEAEIKRKETEYIAKYGKNNAQSLINLEKSSFKLEQTRRRPLMP